MRPNLTSPLCTAVALAAAAVAAPAAAQPYVDEVPLYVSANYVDEVIVPGPMSVDGRTARLSRTISIRDLDLATRQDQALLRLRIRDTARDLCRALGEDGRGYSPVVPSCEDQAVRDARPQVRLAVDQAYARRYAALEFPYAPNPY
jgi:UrcA family protein